MHGRKFIVYTDHNPLQYLFTQPNLSKRQARWLELLAEYDFQLLYIKGSTNQAADALSRRSSQTDPPTDMQLLREVSSRANPQPLHLGRLYAGTNLKLRPEQVLEFAHYYRRDPDFRAHYLRPALPYFRDNGLLYHTHHLCVPKGPLRHDVLTMLHDDPSAGHLGQQKTLERALLRYIWPSMATDVKEYVRTCPECQRNKGSNQRRAGLLHPLQVPSRKWGSVSLDFITGMQIGRAHV